MRNKFDLIFMPHKDYHSRTYLGINKILESKGVSTAFLKPTERHSQSGAIEVLAGEKVTWLENNDFNSLERAPKAVVTMNDWDQSAAHLLDYCKLMGIKIIGLQEGTTDFLRVNWNNPLYTDPARRPYLRSDFLLLASDFDASYFPEAPHAVIGMDRVEPLFHEKVTFPKRNLAIVNLNFSYKVCLEYSRSWLESVANACKAIDLDFVISVHPQDETDVKNFEDRIRREPLHDLIRQGSLFVSRFSNAIYESLAVGKPVVYFNPHGEESRTFNESEDAFSVARNDDELKSALEYELTQRNIRKRAHAYFSSHLSLVSDLSSSERAATAIMTQLEKLERPAPRINSNRNSASVSIIIPAHNIAPYLDRCLDSLLNQTLSDLQIILIDDASSDETLDIMKKYENLDRRIDVQRLHMQSGQSRARNIGMMRVQGSAIMFVDGDDWLRPDACWKAFYKMKNDAADIVVFDYYDYNDPVSTPARHFDFRSVAVGNYKRSDFLRICSPCTKIYNTGFLKRIEAYFPEATIFEDWFWTMQWAVQAKKISALADPLYFYRRNRAGSTTSGHRSEVEVMRGIIRNLGMSKRFLDARGEDYAPLVTLLNKADSRIRLDKNGVSEDERQSGYKILQHYLRSTFHAGLPDGVTQKSIIDLYAGRPLAV